MKKLIQFIFVSLFLASLTTTTEAQKTISEGKVVYEISYPDMEMDAQMQAMMPTESVVFFKNHLSKTEMSMGMGMSNSIIVNSKTGEIISLTDMMGSKNAVKMANEDFNKSKSKTGKPVITLTNETKEIAGYPCKKAIVKVGENTSMDIYYTDKINASTSANVDWEEIPGFPMEYYFEQGGLKMKFTAKTVTPEKIADTLFEIPTGYKVITQEEMKKMMGGGE